MGLQHWCTLHRVLLLQIIFKDACIENSLEKETVSPSRAKGSMFTVQYHQDNVSFGAKASMPTAHYKRLGFPKLRSPLCNATQSAGVTWLSSHVPLEMET